MKDKENSFLTYLEDKYLDNFCEKIKYYVIKNKETILLDRLNVTSACNIEVTDIYFKSVYINDKGNDNIEFDVNCVPTIEFVTYSKRYDTRESDDIYDKWFTVSCSANISNFEFKNFKIIEVDTYNPTKPKKPLSGDLVPIIKRSEYEKYADEILKKYDMYDRAIDPILLANKMGFSVIKRSIKEDKSIFGQTYFYETKIKLWNKEKNEEEVTTVPAKTIIIDEDAISLYSYGSINITIAHECVHAYLHKKAFDFMRMYNPKLKKILSCKTSGKIMYINSEASSYMEAQANGIAPYLLIPRTLLKSKYESVLAYNIDINPDRFKAEEDAITYVAKEMNVTSYAIKKRLIDMGNDHLKGVLNYVDGNYIKPFGFKSGSLGDNETFIIRFEDIVEANIEFQKDQSKNGNLLLAINSGNYIYVENFLILNDKKYWEYDNNGYQVLTSYARCHLDECALKFVCSSDKIKDSGALMYSYLARDANLGNSQVNLLTGLELAEKQNIYDPKNYEIIKKYNDIVRSTCDYINSSTTTFGQALYKIIDINNLSAVDITDKSLSTDSMTARQFRKYLNDEVKNFDKKTIIAICVLLKVDFKISMALLNKAGFTLSNSIEDSYYYTILTLGRGKTLNEANEFLIQNKLEPLTIKRKKN